MTSKSIPMQSLPAPQERVVGLSPRTARLLAFLSGTCIMVIELVASRLVAPRLGVSLYTWTSVIGVMLAGMSLGNLLGGILADRYASRTTLAWLFVIVALAGTSVVWLSDGRHAYDWLEAMPYMLAIVCYVAVVLGLPSILMGCFTPVITRLALSGAGSADTGTGMTVGSIYAWSTIGSILGTFGTGFLLVSFFGVRSIILLVTAVQMALGLLLMWGAAKKRRWLAAGALILYIVVVISIS